MNQLSMRKFYSTFAVIGIAACLFSVSTPFAEAREVLAGVQYETRTITHSGVQVVLRAVVADTLHTRILVEGKGGPQTCNQKFSTTDIARLASEPNFIVAINAQFFNSQGKAIGDYIGNNIQYGTNWPSMQTNSNFVAINHAGDVITGTQNLTPEAATNYSMFINGIFKINRSGSFQDITPAQVTAAFESAYSDSGNAHGTISRTYLGIIPAQHKIILMTGGEGAYRNVKGVSPQEGVDFLKSLGATDGYILDSGGSTMMRQSARFFTPNESFDTDGRSLGNLLVVRSGGPQTLQETAALPVKQCRDSGPVITTGSDNPANPSAVANPQPGNTQPVVGNQPAVSNVNITAGAVALEVPIGDITSINPDGGLITNYAKTLFGYATGLVGLIAMIMLIVSGFQIMVVGGEGIKAAQERIVGVIAGLVLLATGGFVLYLVNPCFFNFTNSNACVARINTGSTQPPPLSVGGGSTGGGNGLSTGDNSQPTAAQPNRPRTPTQYANEKLSEAQSRWQQYGNDFNRAASIMFDGAPGEVFMGFASNGGITELTPGSSFRALGMFGVETGPGPAPAPVAGRTDRWFPLSTDAQVQQFLGRPATTAPDAWKTAIPDQVAVGYANLRDHGIRVMNSMPANIRTTNHGSPWFVAMAAMGWSAGDGTAANIVAPFADRLASVSDQDRWGTFVKLMAEAGANGTIVPRTNTSGHFDSHGAGDSAAGRYDTHDNPFYSVVRTMQKLEAGYTLAQRNNSPNLAFFGYPSGVDRTAVQQTMTNLGYYGVASR